MSETAELLVVGDISRATDAVKKSMDAQLDQFMAAHDEKLRGRDYAICVYPERWMPDPDGRGGGVFSQAVVLAPRYAAHCIACLPEEVAIEVCEGTRLRFMLAVDDGDED